MERHQELLLKVLFILIWILALIHMTAENYYLYWTYKWFDIVTHFLGGAWVGLAGIWTWYFSGYFRRISAPNNKVLWVALGAGLFIGLLWEGYELAVWQWSGAGLPLNYIPDTTLDLIVDIVGAYSGFMFARYVLGIVNKKEEIA